MPKDQYGSSNPIANGTGGGSTSGTSWGHLTPVDFAKQWEADPDNIIGNGVRNSLRTSPTQTALIGKLQGGVGGAGLPYDPRIQNNLNQARGQQTTVIQDLLRAAQGDPNSYAQQQLRTGFNQARGGVAALGAAARGQGAGQAMRGIAGSQAGLATQQNAQRQLLQAQEQQQAIQALLQAQQAQRGQDISNAGLSSQLGLAGQNEADKQYQNLLNLGLKGTAGLAEDQLAFLGAQTGADVTRDRLDSQLYGDLINAANAGVATASKIDWGSPGKYNSDGLLMGSNGRPVSQLNEGD